MPKPTEELMDLKSAAQHPKSDLQMLADKVREISPKDADSLEKIIYELTVWQHR